MTRAKIAAASLGAAALLASGFFGARAVEGGSDPGPAPVVMTVDTVSGLPFCPRPVGYDGACVFRPGEGP